MKLLAVAVLLCGVFLGRNTIKGDTTSASVTAGPYSQQDYRRIREKCGKILNTSPQAMQAAAEANYDDVSSDLVCLIRCIGILANYFDDETGINWDQIERQLQGKQGFEFEVHRRTSMECADALTEADFGDNICNKSFLNFRCVLGSHLKHVESETDGEIF